MSQGVQARGRPRLRAVAAKQTRCRRGGVRSRRSDECGDASISVLWARVIVAGVYRWLHRRCQAALRPHRTRLLVAGVLRDRFPLTRRSRKSMAEPEPASLLTVAMEDDSLSA